MLGLGLQKGTVRQKMIKHRTTSLGVLALAIVAAASGTAYFIKNRPKVIDLSAEGIAGFEACPIHNLAFSSERVSVWHGPFSPHATKEWWERVAEAREKYPFAVAFPAQVDDPDNDVVVRSFCAECREGFEAFVAN
jgi:hypothetical protein